MTTVGERIKARRSEQGLTQDALCKKAEISKGFLSDIENNNRGISANKLHNIANALGASLEYLLTGKADQTKPSPVEVPEGLATIGRLENLSFNTMLMLMDMRQQIVAHRSNSKKPRSDDFDWGKFYNSVKEWLPNG